MKNRRKGWLAPHGQERGGPSVLGVRGLAGCPSWVGDLTSSEDPHYSDGLKPLCGVGVWGHSLTGQRLGWPWGPSEIPHGAERECECTGAHSHSWSLQPGQRCQTTYHDTNKSHTPSDNPTWTETPDPQPHPDAATWPPTQTSTWSRTYVGRHTDPPTQLDDTSPQTHLTCPP